MPELPEVEAARRAIEAHCAGKKIQRSVVADDSKVIDGISPSELESALAGKTIVAALRKGKNLWLRLDSPPFPSFQFGMTGAVYIKGVAVTKYKRSAVSDKDEWPSKFSKVFMELEDGLELSFIDKRRFARVRLLQDPEVVPPISELGPDALLEPLQTDELVDALSKKNNAIKALLLDQSFVSGIGNWIADEVLYQVIEKAVEVEADSSQYPSNWIFHSREKKPGKAFVDGKQIEFIAAGGRTSAFVPELQKLTVAKSVKAKANRSRKAKPEEEEEEDNVGSEGEAIEKEKEIKRPQPKKRKNEKETPTKKNGKKPLTADKVQQKVVKENKDELKPLNRRTKTQVKESSKKRSESNEAITQQKKKTSK